MSTPHQDEKHARPFVEGLMDERRRLHGFADTVQLDREALEQLKRDLANDSKTVAVK